MCFVSLIDIAIPFLYWLQVMHSNTPFNRNSMENAESYHEVFKVLDSLGMADLKETFQEHCIQVFDNCMYTQ